MVKHFIPGRAWRRRGFSSQLDGMQQRKLVWVCVACLQQYDASESKGTTVPVFDDAGNPVLTQAGRQKRVKNTAICDHPEWGCGGKVFLFFPSEGEAMRFAHLRLQERQGLIVGLRVGVKYPLRTLSPAGEAVEVGSYIADFVYSRAGEVVIEDYKGAARDEAQTRLFQHKKKHFEAQYGIRITVVTK